MDLLKYAEVRHLAVIDRAVPYDNVMRATLKTDAMS
jgi:hypothetical protein